MPIASTSQRILSGTIGVNIPTAVVISGPTISVSLEAIVNSTIGAAVLKELCFNPFHQFNGKWPSSSSLNDLPTSALLTDQKALLTDQNMSRVAQLITQSTKHIQAVIALLLSVEYVRVQAFYLNTRQSYMPGYLIGGEGYYSSERSNIEARKIEEQRDKIAQYRTFVENQITTFDKFVEELKILQKKLSEKITYSPPLEDYPLLKESIEKVNTLRDQSVIQINQMMDVYNAALLTLKERVRKIGIPCVDKEIPVSFVDFDTVNGKSYVKLKPLMSSDADIPAIIQPYSKRLESIKKRLPYLFSMCSTYNVICFMNKLIGTNILGKKTQNNLHEQVAIQLRGIESFESYINSFKDDLILLRSSFTEFDLTSKVKELSETNDTSYGTSYTRTFRDAQTTIRDMLVDVEVILKTISDRKTLITIELNKTQK